MDKDEIAFKMVELYVNQIADTQEKRRMGLDTVMNAYFYCLLRLTRKKREMEAFDKAVTKEEEFLETKDPVKSEEEELPQMQEKPQQNMPRENGEEFEFD